MYPDANITVYQLSIDATRPAEDHYQLAKSLKELRKQGVLILGSGNIVHNLRVIEQMDDGFPWAYEFDSFIKDAILQKNHEAFINYKKHPFSSFAVPTPDHFYPLLYVLGAMEDDDQVEIYNEACTLGSLSMTSYLIK